MYKTNDTNDKNIYRLYHLFYIEKIIGDIENM